MTEGWTDGMTVLSRQAFDAAAAPEGTAALAAGSLATIPVRTFPELLARYAPGEASREKLTEGLCRNNPSRSRESMDRKVRGWLSGKYQPTAREDLLELCFLLRLSPEEADAFLAAVSEEGFHWRDPRELTYAYALRKSLDYPEAAALYARVKPDRDEKGEGTAESYTALVRQEAEKLQSEEELRQYLRDAGDRLGLYHNRAYGQMMDFLSLLEKPGTVSGEEEESFTVRRIIETYLDSRFPPSWDKKTLDEKRRGILAGWPDEVTLSRMKARKTDVNRKTLILLFLATDGGQEITDDWEEDVYWDELEDEEDGEADFRSSCLRMNQMLTACGYRMLDPRNPFDWVVLYSLRVSGDPETMEGLSERLAELLDVLFSAAGPETE